ACGVSSQSAITVELRGERTAALLLDQLGRGRSLIGLREEHVLIGDVQALELVLLALRENDRVIRSASKIDLLLGAEPLHELVNGTSHLWLGLGLHERVNDARLILEHLRASEHLGN